MDSRVLTWRAVLARRMARHALDAPSAELGPAGIAGVLCGAHAQVMSAAELSVARRVAGATVSDVRRALWENRRLIKTHGPRGTVHLLAADDMPMWTGALSALPPSTPSFPPPVGFSPEQVDEVVAAIGDALSGEELTVDELTAALRVRLGEWAVERTMDAFQEKWPRWRQVTSTAAHRGVLCFGAGKGRNVAYTNPGRWIPGFAPLPAPEALWQLVMRYLHAYGPATPQQFAQWLAIPARIAAEVFDGLADRLHAVEVEGQACWLAAGDTETFTESTRGVRLLPYFDGYVVAGHPRERLFPGIAARRALSPSGQAGNYPVVLVDGVVGGVWHARRSGQAVAITVEPLRPLSTAQRRSLDADLELVGATLGARPSLTIGPVDVGPHA